VDGTAAYARASQGVVVDAEQASVLSASQAKEVVAQIGRDRPGMEAALRDIERKFAADGCD
jgi:hypothetical protein